MRGAIAAIQTVIIAARTMASRKAAHEKLADVLDIAEYLPGLILEPRDRTQEFREQLVGLAEKYPAFSWALQRFDSKI